MRIPNALPRAYVAHAVEIVPDDSAALHVLRDKEFDPAQKVVIEGRPQGLSLSGEGISPATVRQRSPQDIIVDTESSQDGVLVLTDSDYPGWHALVDGREKPILHANYLFRGVEIPAGQTYDLSSLRQRLVPSRLLHQRRDAGADTAADCGPAPAQEAVIAGTPVWRIRGGSYPLLKKKAYSRSTGSLASHEVPRPREGDERGPGRQDATTAGWISQRK